MGHPLRQTHQGIVLTLVPPGDILTRDIIKEKLTEFATKPNLSEKTLRKLESPTDYIKYLVLDLVSNTLIVIDQEEAEMRLIFS